LAAFDFHELKKSPLIFPRQTIIKA
jgi:hypothetical protein